MRLACLLLLLTWVAPGCERNGPKGRTPSPQVPPSGIARLVVVSRQGKQHNIDAELALTHAQRIQGLMYRNYLPNDRGMLFVYPEKESRSMWMKNCRIPIAVAYLDDNGTILQIEKMKVEPPGTEHYPSYQANQEIRLALEMSVDWFDLHRIVVGDRVEIPPGLIRRGRP